MAPTSLMQCLQPGVLQEPETDDYSQSEPYTYPKLENMDIDCVVGPREAHLQVRAGGRSVRCHAMEYNIYSDSPPQQYLWHLLS